MTQAIYNARAKAAELEAMKTGERSPDRYWAAFADRETAQEFARWLALHDTATRGVYRSRGGWAVNFWDQGSIDHERELDREAQRKFDEAYRASGAEAEGRRGLWLIALIGGIVCLTVIHPVLGLLAAILAVLLWIASSVAK